MFEFKTILITDNIDKRCCNRLSEIKEANILIKPTLPKKDLLQIIKNVDCLLVRSATEVDSDIINAGKCLKLIGRAGTGTDNINVHEATEKGILVMNTPSGNTLSAAELTCAMLMSLSRMIPQATASLKQNKWERSKFMGNELFHKTLAIIGLGRIGREVGDRMRSFGMKTIGYDPLVTPEIAAKFDIEWLPLNQIWPLADYITLHTPLIPQTKNLINVEVFKACKPTVKIVNCARGGIVNEMDLLTALNNGTCAGAALDVFTQEPPNFGDEPENAVCQLLKHDRVVCTPHLGASTKEAQLRVAEELALQIIALNQISKPEFAQKLESEQKECLAEALIGIVNAPSLAYEYRVESKGWMKLARVLGIMLGTVVDPLNQNYGKSCPIKLLISGDCDDRMGLALLDSFLTGIMKAHTKNGLTIIGAPRLLKRIYNIEPSEILVRPSCSGKIKSGTTQISYISALILNHDVARKSWSYTDIEDIKESSHFYVEGIYRDGFENCPILTRWCNIGLWPRVLPLLEHPQSGFLISKSTQFEPSNSIIKEIIKKSGANMILYGPPKESGDDEGDNKWKFIILDKRAISTIEDDNDNGKIVEEGVLCMLPDGKPCYKF